MDAVGLISDISGMKKVWNRILAPSLTFETRDDIFTLNKPKLFILMEIFSCVSGEDFC